MSKVRVHTNSWTTIKRKGAQREYKGIGNTRTPSKTGGDPDDRLNRGTRKWSFSTLGPLAVARCEERAKESKTTGKKR